MMTHEEMDAKMDEHFGYEMSDNVDGVMNTLAQNVRHDVVGWPAGPATRRDDVRPFYETMFADIAGEKVTTLRRFYGENFLVDESLWEGKAPGRPFGLEGKGRPVKFRILHVVEFDESKQMKSEQVWVDFLALTQQLPQDGK